VTSRQRREFLAMHGQSSGFNLKKGFLAIHGQASGFRLHSLEDNNSTSYLPIVYLPIVVKARVSEWDESLSSTADYGGG
jgi:hypothetical protein